MSALRRTTIGIIGAGNMGQALIKGLLGFGLSPQRIVAVEPDRNRRLAVARQYRVRCSGVTQLARTCDALVLAVKPQDIRPVLMELDRSLRKRNAKPPLIISIVAGVKLAWIERILGRIPVVRIMPNLAAKVGSAISVLACGRFATPPHRALAKAIFRCVGEVVELPERLFDAVTAISGSGPAYFFLIFQALRDAGVKAGVPKRIAESLAVHTALGSAQLVNGLREDLDALIAQVASKRGTTEAALKVFRKRRLAGILHAGVLAAMRRSKELSSHHLSGTAKGSPSPRSSRGEHRRGGEIGPSGRR